MQEKKHQKRPTVNNPSKNKEINFFQQYLKQVVEGKEVSLKTLSEITGINRGTLKNYIYRENTEPSPSNLWAIANALKVSADYLWTGKVPVIPPPATKGKNADFFEAELCGTVGAGPAIVSVYKKIEKVALHKAVKGRFGGGEYISAWVDGDSMEPLIKKGSLVVCKKERISPETAKWEHIYCVNIPAQDGAVIKKVRYDTKSGEIWLYSINPAHEPEQYKRGKVEIIGRVVGIAWQEI